MNGCSCFFVYSTRTTEVDEIDFHSQCHQWHHLDHKYAYLDRWDSTLCPAGRGWHTTEAGRFSCGTPACPLSVHIFIIIGMNNNNSLTTTTTRTPKGFE